MSFNTGFSSVNSEEEAIEVVKHEPQIISSLPEEFLTDNVLFEALSRDHSCYDFINIDDLSSSLVGRLLINDHTILELLPNRVFRYGNLVRFVRVEGLNVQYIPEHMLDTGICIEAIQSNPEAHLFVPKKFQDKNYTNTLISKNPEFVGEIDSKDRNNKLLRELVLEHPQVIRYMIMPERSKEICLSVLKKDVSLIQYFPEDIYNDLDVLEAISEQPEFQSYKKTKQQINTKSIDELMFGEDDELDSEPQKNTKAMGNYFQANIVRLPLARYLFEKDKSIFPYLPQSVVDLELAKDAVAYDSNNIFSIMPALKSDGKLWEYALTINESLYDKVPVHQRSANIKIFIARKEAEKKANDKKNKGDNNE